MPHQLIQWNRSQGLAFLGMLSVTMSGVFSCVGLVAAFLVCDSNPVRIVIALAGSVIGLVTVLLGCRT